MVTNESFRLWLEQYLRPKEKRNPEKIKELFAQDAVYWYGPYYPPRHGLKAIYEHRKNALSHQEDLSCDYDVLATTES